MLDLTFYKNYREKLLAMRYVDFVTEWDNETQAPRASSPELANRRGVLAEMEYKMSTADEWQQEVERLFAARDQLDEVTRHEVVELKKETDNMKKIPMEEYVAYQRTVSEGYAVYVDAKRKGDFSMFLPYLQKIIDYCRKQTVWLATDKRQGYDVLLDVYEPDSSQKEYDEFFDVLREKLVPFVKKVAATKLEGDFSFAQKTYPAQGQKEFCEYVRGVMCFDKERGFMTESEHPFTSGWCNKDVRITNHYYENNFTSSILSCIHETGHALYETQVSDCLEGTFCTGGASLGLHESQSRFYENVIGRSKGFWKTHFAKLKEIFPKQLKGVRLEDFYRYINKVELSFVRTEADELTYPLHIMLRYQMEKEIILGKLEAVDVPARWNQLVKEYLGLDVPNDTLGCLQDVHWAYGNFGYFPTYALGSAIASQFYHRMNKDFNVQKTLDASGNTKAVNDWLKEHLHQYGSSKYPKELMKIAVGEKFNPKYYVDYLIKKYSKIYSL